MKTNIDFGKEFVYIGGKPNRSYSLFISRAIFGAILSTLFLSLSLIKVNIGAKFHLSISLIALRSKWSKLGMKRLYRLLFAPMDSVRYFEFEFFWNVIENSNLGKYLDISSPRLFTLRVLKQGLTETVTVANPDLKDLNETEIIYNGASVNNNVNLVNKTASELNKENNNFDTIVCISVIEHIPHDHVEESLHDIWRMLKPGGSLLISLPCCRESYDEYINIDEYGLLKSDNNGFIFGQTFYNDNLIDDRLISIFGPPIQKKIFGEKICGTFNADRELKLTSNSYPFWRESSFVAKNYNYFNSTENMPGLGVVALVFHKK